jgi:hypothetical protein
VFNPRSRYPWYKCMLYSSVTCSSFLHQENWPPWQNWNSITTVLKGCTERQLIQSIALWSFIKHKAHNSLIIAVICFLLQKKFNAFKIQSKTSTMTDINCYWQHISEDSLKSSNIINQLQNFNSYPIFLWIMVSTGKYIQRIVCLMFYEGSQCNALNELSFCASL